MAGLYTQLTPEQIKSITDQATQLGQQQGISPEQALYDYAQTQGLSNGAVDTLMGFAPGSTTSWAQQNIPNYQSSNTAPVAQVLTSAPANTPTTTTPAAPAATPATTTPDTSTNLGFGAPATAANPQLAYAPTTPQVDTSYTKNPYLDQMAQDITTAATDSWTRNIDPTIRSDAASMGSYGGSRQGVVEANALKDLNSSLSTSLTDLYGTDYTNAQNRNLQQQSVNNGYNLGLQSNVNNYDLGLRSSDLGFANLDANIYQNNFNNQLASANFGLSTYNTLNANNTNAVNAGTAIQNTPLDYQKYFTNSANGVGSGYSTSTTDTTALGDPYTSALGGALAGNQIGSSLSNSFSSGTDNGYSTGTGSAYGGTYDSNGVFTPYRSGM